MPRIRIVSALVVLPLVLALALVGWSRAAAAQDATPVAGGDIEETRVFELPGDEVYPEGVAYDPVTNMFYTGSTTDGTIFRGDLATGDVEVFSEGGADGRTLAVGMKVDTGGRLFVAGGSTGMVHVYDTATGGLVGMFGNGLGEEETFLNDIAVSRFGDAFITDSRNPVIWVIPGTTFAEPEADPAASPVASPVATPVGTPAPLEGDLETFLELEGTAIQYQDGTNLNGIVATEGGNYLVTVQTNTGQLFRIDIASGAIDEINLGGGNVQNGDGLALDRDQHYVVQTRDGVVTRVDLTFNLLDGEVTDSISDPTFAFPTTIALVQGTDTALVVNSQFDARESGEPDLPFTVSHIVLPPVLPGGGGTPAASPAASPAA